MRQNWTDSRMDDLKDEVTVLNGRLDQLSRKVDDGFVRLDGKVDSLGERLDSRIEKLDGKIDGLGEKLDGKIDSLGERLDGRIDSLGTRIDSLVRAATIVGAGLVAAFLGFLATVLGLVITHV